MADSMCPRCKSHDQAVPTEIQLRQLIFDRGLEMEAFVPLAGNGEQATALAAYAHGVSLLVAAFGVEIAGARVNRTWGMLRVFAKLRRVFDRIDAARAPVQAEIRARYDRGEIGPDQANEIAKAAPTPDYEGRSADDVWLKRVLGVEADAL